MYFIVLWAVTSCNKGSRYQRSGKRCCQLQLDKPTSTICLTGYQLMFIGTCIILIVEELKTNLMSLVISFHFLCAQHVSDINIAIIRSLRLLCWITTLVVLFCKDGGFIFSVTPNTHHYIPQFTLMLNSHWPAYEDGTDSAFRNVGN